jgi:phosphate starvation-inducible PhoH-like protein
VTFRGGDVVVSGPSVPVQHVLNILTEFDLRAAQGRVFTEHDLRVAIELARDDRQAELIEWLDERVAFTFDRKTVAPRSAGQRYYLTQIAGHDLVFCIGPAGTGKTYLAVAAALDALFRRQVRRIVLARPAVEAGENLGFLPGDLYQKVHPYLRPLYDALFDLIPRDRAQRLVDRGDVEVAPLAFMRGRTLKDSFVILDEAQNTTTEQMKMCLTRLGIHSKAVVTGDITQIDLAGRPSGLVEAQTIFHGIDEISFVYLTDRDVVRHRLVRLVIEAYARRDARRGGDEEGGREDA